MKNHYEILEVGRKATLEEIKKAYRKKALMFHPDKNSGSKIASEKFKEICSSYKTLIDKKKRAEYDLTLPPISNYDSGNKTHGQFHGNRSFNSANSIHESVVSMFNNPKVPTGTKTFLGILYVISLFVNKEK